MRKAVLIPIGLFAACLALSSCDGYKYKGMDGDQAFEASEKMSLPDAYVFYIETYKGTSPPMLDVAKTFRRFGKDGINYIENKALNTGDSQEFEANMMALVVLDVDCAPELAAQFRDKALQIEADASYVSHACG